MFTFLWGDILGLISGDTDRGMIGDNVYQATHPIWVGMAALMLTPIVMIVLNLTLNHSAIRWVNIIVAAFWLLFNLISLFSYPAYNKFLLIVSIVFNTMVVWYAWNWTVMDG